MSDDESAGPVEVSAIANPLASDKLEKKLYKVTKKGPWLARGPGRPGGGPRLLR